MPKKSMDQKPATKGDLKALATKADLNVVKADLNVVKADLQAVRTELKGDLQAVRTELKGDLQAVRTELKGDLQAVRTELKGGIDRIALKVIEHDRDLKEIKENMLTKQDKNEIMNTLDKIMGEFKSFDNSIVIRGRWMEEHGEKLTDHENRLKKLEAVST